MKNNWTRTFRRLAAACAIGGATAFSSAMSYAASIAYDTATDVAYDDGWQAGDNGGFGFGPWNFDNGYAGTNPSETMDIFSPPNDLGRAWTLYLQDGGNPGNPPGYVVPLVGTDLGRAGRAIPGGLQPGDTLHVVIDNPTEKLFYKGYTVKFTNGGANMCYAGDDCSTPAYDPGSITKKMRIGTFEYFTNGKWYLDAATGGSPTLFDVNTNHGMRIDLTITGVDAYSLTMTPLNDPSIAFSTSGTLLNAGAGPITWVEFELYNTDSDWYPVPTGVGHETDFYVSNMWITNIPEPATFSLLALGAGAMLGVGGARNRKEQ